MVGVEETYVENPRIFYCPNGFLSTIQGRVSPQVSTICVEKIFSQKIPQKSIPHSTGAVEKLDVGRGHALAAADRTRSAENITDVHLRCKCTGKGMPSPYILIL